jgi:hypothetical protein
LTDNTNLIIGGRTATYYFEGLISEVRFSNILRSAAWIKATNYNLRDTLVSFGSPEIMGISLIAKARMLLNITKTSTSKAAILVNTVKTSTSKGRTQTAETIGAKKTDVSTVIPDSGANNGGADDLNKYTSRQLAEMAYKKK